MDKISNTFLFKFSFSKPKNLSFFKKKNFNKFRYIHSFNILILKICLHFLVLMRFSPYLVMMCAVRRFGLILVFFSFIILLNFGSSLQESVKSVQLRIVVYRLFQSFFLSFITFNIHIARAHSFFFVHNL